MDAAQEVTYPVLYLSARRRPLYKYAALLDAGRDWRKVYAQIHSTIDPVLIRDAVGMGLPPLCLGLLVLDIDDLERCPFPPAELAKLPACCRVRTPGGGLHIWAQEPSDPPPILKGAFNLSVKAAAELGERVPEIKHRAVVPLPGTRRAMGEGRTGLYVSEDDRIKNHEDFLARLNEFPRLRYVQEIFNARAEKILSSAIDKGASMAGAQEKKQERKVAARGGDLDHYIKNLPVGEREPDLARAHLVFIGVGRKILRQGFDRAAALQGVRSLVSEGKYMLPTNFSTDLENEMDAEIQRQEKAKAKEVAAEFERDLAEQRVAEELNEENLAAEFCLYAQGVLRFVLAGTATSSSRDSRWVFFNGVVWDDDSVGNHASEHRRLLSQFLQYKIKGVRGRLDKVDVKRHRFYTRYLQNTRQSHLLARAAAGSAAIEGHRVNPLLATTASFNTRPHLFAFQDGVYDLNKNIFIEDPRPDFLISLQSRLAYPGEVTVKGSRLEAMLYDAFGGEARCEWVLALVAQSLRGDVVDRRMIILWGDASNGKTLFANLVREVFGTYACKIDFDAFIPQRLSTSGAASPALARARNARLIHTSEPPLRSAFSDGLVKDLLGNEPRTDRALYAKGEEYLPQYQILLTTNHLPKVADTAGGFWRRIVVIQMRKTFKNSNEVDKYFRSDEAKGIFARMLLNAYARLPLMEDVINQMPPDVKEAINFYRAGNDTMTEWISSDSVEIDKANRGICEPLTILYNSYEKFCQANTMKPLGSRALRDFLRRTNFSVEKALKGIHRKKLICFGIRVSPDDVL